jgi:hypothetical protein
VIGYVNDDISGDIEIKKLVEKNENDKKIVELFKTQLYSQSTCGTRP